MRYKRTLVAIGLILFLLSLPLLVLDYTDNLPVWLKKLFTYRFLFGLCIKDLSHIGLIWKVVLLCFSLIFLRKIGFRKAFAYMWTSSSSS
jgi:hypothetical protein